MNQQDEYMAAEAGGWAGGQQASLASWDGMEQFLDVGSVQQTTVGSPVGMNSPSAVQVATAQQQLFAHAQAMGLQQQVMSMVDMPMGRPVNISTGETMRMLLSQQGVQLPQPQQQVQMYTLQQTVPQQQQQQQQLAFTPANAGQRTVLLPQGQMPNTSVAYLSDSGNVYVPTQQMQTVPGMSVSMGGQVWAEGLRPGTAWPTSPSMPGALYQLSTEDAQMRNPLRQMAYPAGMQGIQQGMQGVQLLQAQPGVAQRPMLWPPGTSRPTLLQQQQQQQLQPRPMGPAHMGSMAMQSNQAALLQLALAGSRINSGLQAMKPHKPRAHVSRHHRLFKTELCRHWMQTGICAYGTKCQFAHGQPELMARPLTAAQKAAAAAAAAEAAASATVARDAGSADGASVDCNNDSSKSNSHHKSHVEGDAAGYASRSVSSSERGDAGADADQLGAFASDVESERSACMNSVTGSDSQLMAQPAA